MTKYFRNTSILALALVVAVTCAAGCGGDSKDNERRSKRRSGDDRNRPRSLADHGVARGYARVQGVVLLDGQPVADAQVTFIASDSERFATGVTDDKGRFSLVARVKGKIHEGAPLSNCRVTIAKYGDLPSKTTLPEGGDFRELEPRMLTPPKYAHPEASPLTVDVSDKDNDFTFELLTDG